MKILVMKLQNIAVHNHNFSTTARFLHRRLPSPFKVPVVTICTTSLTFTNSTFCPHSCIYVFCVDLRTNSDNSLYSINWLVFITEMECVYCAVRTECLNAIRYNLGLNSWTHTPRTHCCTRHKHAMKWKLQNYISCVSGRVPNLLFLQVYGKNDDDVNLNLNLHCRENVKSHLWKVLKAFSIT
jgi:hypothetical protein